MAKKKKGASAGSGAAAVKGKRSAAAKNASAAPPSARVLVGATDAVVSVPLADGAEATVGALRAGVIAAAALDAGDTAWVLRWHDADAPGAARRLTPCPRSTTEARASRRRSASSAPRARSRRRRRARAAGLRVDAPRGPDAPREVPFASRTEGASRTSSSSTSSARERTAPHGGQCSSRGRGDRRVEALRARIVADDDPVAARGRAARARSDCASFEHDGDLGNRARGKMNKEFEAAIFALAIDELSGVVDTEVGVHIVQRRPLE